MLFFLVSLHMAMRLLTTQRYPAAINAGINLLLSPHTPVAFYKTEMLSSEGRCKILDAAADGYVRAEACASFLPALDSYEADKQYWAI